MTARTICHSRCSGTSCQPSNGGLVPRLALGICRAAPWRPPRTLACRCRIARQRAPGISAGVGGSRSGEAKPSTVSTLRALYLYAQHQARVDQTAVEQDVARTAVAVVAAFFAASQTQLVAQHFEQTLARLAQKLGGLPLIVVWMWSFFDMSRPAGWRDSKSSFLPLDSRSSLPTGPADTLEPANSSRKGPGSIARSRRTVGRVFESVHASALE